MAQNKKNPDDSLFRNYAPDSAESFIVGQGFQSLSFRAEQRAVNVHLKKKRACHYLRLAPCFFTPPVKETGTCQTTILSAAAIAVIKAIDEAVPPDDERRKAAEPNSMLPSTNPDEYSKVGTNRNPFGRR